jgi:energy-coupling factor transporter ATP-binding protein EcfA2
MSSQDSGFFATANARFRSPELIARTFVPPEQFQRLTKVSHTVMVGPRGSGKTTLLKMLTPEALEASSAVKRFRLQEGVKFTGIFVPADISWNRQVAALEDWDVPSQVTADLFEASFVASVIRSFSASIHERLTRSVPQIWLNLAPLTLSPEEESAVARALADVWRLDLRIPSFLGLRAAASARIVELGNAASQIHRTNDFASLEPLLAGGDLVAQMTLALDVLEALVPALRGEKWCLLFDELELAPPAVRRSLMSAMRSVDDRLIFKLAISPYSSDLSDLLSVVAAMPGHDHDEIWLSYGHKRDAMRFSFDLMEEVVRERLGQEVNLEALLGTALFPAEDPEGLIDKAPGGDLSNTQEDYVRDLYDIDRSFAAYVDQAVGGVDQLLATTGQQRAQYLRKILPLVIVRVAFRTSDLSRSSGSRRYRSRKSPHIYAGATALAAVLEGNPRWIIGVMSALLEKQGQRISAQVQSGEITQTRNRFRALLSTIPISQSSVDTRRGLLPLIDRIGQSFRLGIVGANFTSDPVGTFVVDASASDALVDALGSAVNTGAIVYVPDSNSSGLLTSMRGKRFRLSYLLSTGYQLPLRLERAASLRAVLAKGVTDEQPELFSDL